MPARRRRRPRGHIEELPSGTFRAVVYAGGDPLTGRPRYLRETAKTYDAAEVALTRLPLTASLAGRAGAERAATGEAVAR